MTNLVFTRNYVHDDRTRVKNNTLLSWILVSVSATLMYDISLRHLTLIHLCTIYLLVHLKCRLKFFSPRDFTKSIHQIILVYVLYSHTTNSFLTLVEVWIWNLVAIIYMLLHFNRRFKTIKERFQKMSRKRLCEYRVLLC